MTFLNFSLVALKELFIILLHFFVQFYPTLLEQLSAVASLRDDVDLRVVLEILVNLDYVGVVKHFQNFDLLEETTQVLLVQVRLGEDLHGSDYLGSLPYAGSYLPKRTYSL